MILHLRSARRQHFHADVMLENRRLRRLVRNAEHVADHRDWNILALIAIAMLVLLVWRLV